MKKKLRIFISSPGDVKLERGIAKRVIEEVASVYSEYVELETIMWEDLPLEATNSFQGGIDYFLNQVPIDIAVFILWSRLGSTLGHKYQKSDGTIYASGTEYEFDTMFALWQQTQRPKIMVYVKGAEPQIAGGLSRHEIKEALSQKDSLDKFISERFHDAETNTNYAYWQFDKQQTFEDRLRTHLSRLVKDSIGQDVKVKEWEGNPYVGLKSYDASQSSIFCGRKDLVYDIAEKMTQQSERNGIHAPLFVLGESGSGKSSLIRAGLLPHLQHSMDEARQFELKDVVPSSFHGDFYNGLVKILADTFTFLKDNPVIDDLHIGIKNDYDFKHLKYAIETNNHEKEVVVFIDQLEELFSDSLVTEEERLRTLLLLKGLSDIKHLQLIFSMRSDFYNRFSQYPDLGYIKNISIVIDVPKVSLTDITDIVEIPAQKANLKWEINDKGVRLSKQIIKDAAALAQLPLIEFGLSELYNTCKDGNELTYSAYESIGKLSGAVVQYATKLYESFSDAEKQAFLELLGSVVTVSDKDESTFVRKTTLRRNAEKSEAHKSVLSKLIEAHLFVSGKDALGEATITIVHEMLLNSWPVVKEWCTSQLSFLKDNDYYEKQARYWETNGKTEKELIQERSLLLKAEYFLYKYELLLQPITREYLTLSLKKQRRKGLIKHIFGFVGLLLIFLRSIPIVLNGTTGDSDIDKSVNISSWRIGDILILFLPLLLLSGGAIFLRASGKPKYKTIKKTSLLLIGLIVFPFCYTLYAFSCEETKWFKLGYLILFVLTAITICAITIWIENYRRKLWRKGIFKPYLISDRFEEIKNILLYASILLVSLVLGSVLLDKNLQYKKTIAVADELFDGLNNISSQLSWIDIKYINETRILYLKERFEDDLNDTIPDDREFQYATCLYNLFYPRASTSFLYPTEDPKNLFLFIKNCIRLGLYDVAASYTELYIKAGCFVDNEFNWAETSDLIWIAEECGRFDLAAQLYELIEKNGIDWRNESGGYWINFGHIHLMNGKYDETTRCYSNAINNIESANNPTIIDSALREYFNTNIQNDMNLFRWLEVGDQAMIDKVIQQHNYPNREFYTSNNDTTETSNYKQMVAGTWILSDSTIMISYDDTFPICQYRLYDNNNKDNEIQRALTTYRSSIRDDRRYLEEYDREQGIISSNEVLQLNENTLKLRIIENGDESAKGTIRVYTKIVE